jgi:hypothetical protein
VLLSEKYVYAPLRYKVCISLLVEFEYITSSKCPTNIFLAYFPHFEKRKIEVGLSDYHAFCVSVCIFACNVIEAF